MKGAGMTGLIHVGLGPLGQRIVRYACDRGMRYVAAVDPAMAGRDLGQVCGIAPLGIPVVNRLAEAVAARKAAEQTVALVTTVSSLAKLETDLGFLARARIPAISTCEELVFPWNTQPEIARRIDSLFKENGVACLGTGVNPGFLMDYLPIVSTGICQRIDMIRVSRIQDASVRRLPFQQKIGAGLTREAFNSKEAEGTLRHVGLRESVDMIAHKMGWKLDRMTETLAPIIAQRELTSGFTPIHPGMACGVEQIARGYRGDREVVTLHFRAAIGQPDPHDRIELDGEPPVDIRIAGGVNGDVATCALTLNAIRSVLAAPPGLRTMCDVSTVAFSVES
jgi:2,4-diaminopentanoate dehydrogenase